MNELDKLLKLVGAVITYYRVNDMSKVVDKLVLLEDAYANYNNSLNTAVKLDLPDTSCGDKECNKPSQKDRHVGSSDYSKHSIQPYNIWTEYELDPFRADLVKRILRTKSEQGKTLRECKIQDLHKMVHIIQTMIEDYENNNFPWDKL